MIHTVNSTPLFLIKRSFFALAEHRFDPVGGAASQGRKVRWAGQKWASGRMASTTFPKGQPTFWQSRSRTGARRSGVALRVELRVIVLAAEVEGESLMMIGCEQWRAQSPVRSIGATAFGMQAT